MLNPKQQAIVDWVKSQLEFFEESNDIKSPTHYNDIEQTLEDVCDENEINIDLKLSLSAIMKLIHFILTSLQ